MYINKVLLYGNLTRDPELRSMPSGVKVTNFSLATNRVWKDKDGTRQESTDFHNVVVFARQAETVAQYLRKGSPVYVEGRIQTRSWDDKVSGEKKYRTEIVADTIQFGPKIGGAGGGYDPSASSGQAIKSKGVADMTAPPLETIEYPADDISASDIPF